MMDSDPGSVLLLLCLQHRRADLHLSWCLADRHSSLLILFYHYSAAVVLSVEWKFCETLTSSNGSMSATVSDSNLIQEECVLFVELHTSPHLFILIYCFPLEGPPSCSSSLTVWAVLSMVRWRCQGWSDPAPSAQSCSAWAPCHLLSSRSPRAKCTAATCHHWWGGWFSY